MKGKLFDVLCILILSSTEECLSLSQLWMPIDKHLLLEEKLCHAKNVRRIGVV